MIVQSSPTHPHAQGKPEEVLQSTKHFILKQRFSILLSSWGRWGCFFLDVKKYCLHPFKSWNLHCNFWSRTSSVHSVWIGCTTARVWIISFQSNLWSQGFLFVVFYIIKHWMSILQFSKKVSKSITTKKQTKLWHLPRRPHYASAC